LVDWYYIGDWLDLFLEKRILCHFVSSNLLLHTTDGGKYKYKYFYNLESATMTFASISNVEEKTQPKQASKKTNDKTTSFIDHRLLLHPPSYSTASPSYIHSSISFPFLLPTVET